MFEQYFTINHEKMDSERIIKFEKYKREMFEEGADKKKFSTFA
jgi:hypothetical protein